MFRLTTQGTLMEFIGRFHDVGKLAELRHLLRSKGIPTLQTQVEGSRMGKQWVLFVCINEQADDARRILHDSGHMPVVSVDAARFERALDNPDLRLITKWVTIVLGAVIAVFAALVYLGSRFNSNVG